MAEVPTVDAPQVSQSSGAIGVQAQPDAFSGNVIAGGLDKIGQTLGVDSDTLAKRAETYQAMNNKAEADGAFVQHLNAVNQYAANYQANNLGKAATDNLPEALQDIDTQRTTIGDTLSNPTARAMYDADSRRATANITGELSRFAATQNKQYILKQSSAVQEALASDTVIHPEQFDANMQKMMQQQVGINQQLGLSDEEGQLEARKLYGNTVHMVTTTMAGTGNISEASAFLEAHKDGMDGKIYAQTLMELKPALQANDAATGGAAAAADALHGLNSSIGPSVDYLNAVHGREGSTQNPHSTADGIGQFTQGTWLKLVKSDPQFSSDIQGKSDADILAMRHDPSVANRAILAYAQQNAGVLAQGGYAVNAASVGVLHGYGPGDGPKILSAFDQNPGEKIDDIVGPQIAKNNGVSGQTVSQVVGAFQQRFGQNQLEANNNGTPTAAQIKSRLGTAMQLAQAQAEAKYPGNQAIADQYVAKAQTTIMRQAGAASDREGQAYQTLGQVALDNQYQDLPTLLKAVPNGLQMYNSLPLSQRTALQADIHHNATEITASRQQNIVGLNGMYALKSTDPSQFLGQDIANMDLPLNQKIDFLKKQEDLRAKPASTVDPNDKIIHQIQTSNQYKSLIGPDGLNITPKSTDEMHLLGTMSGSLTAWNASHPGQAPQQKDIQAILADSAAQHATHYEIGGVRIPFSGSTTPAYDIPDDHRVAITKALQDNHVPVSEYNIARYHALGVAQQAGAKQ